MDVYTHYTVGHCLLFTLIRIWDGKHFVFSETNYIISELKRCTKYFKINYKLNEQNVSVLHHEYKESICPNWIFTFTVSEWMMILNNKLCYLVLCCKFTFPPDDKVVCLLSAGKLGPAELRASTCEERSTKTIFQLIKLQVKHIIKSLISWYTS